MADLPSAIVDLEDFNESTNMIIYGDSGVGKTVLAGTAPRALVIATEAGTTSAKRFGSTAKAWPVKSWADFVAAYDWLSENPDTFEWVIIDSLTEMQSRSLRGILDKAIADNPLRDPDVPAIQDYQKWQLQVKNYITYFNELPVNVIWTAGAMRKEDQEGEDIVLPLLLGKNYEISAWACMQMDIVGYYGTKTIGKGEEKATIRRLVTMNTPPYFAKDRFDCLGKWIDNPTMSDIIDAIETSGSEDREEVAAKPAAKKASARRTRRAAATEEE